jgi:hypothetical protein
LKKSVVARMNTKSVHVAVVVTTPDIWTKGD